MAEKELKAKITADTAKFDTGVKRSMSALTNAIGLGTSAVSVIKKGFESWGKVIKTIVFDAPIESAKAYIETLKGIGAELERIRGYDKQKNATATSLLDYLGELNDANVSVAEKTKLAQDAIDRLNKLRKGLGLTVDAETGKVNALIDAYAKLASTQNSRDTGNLREQLKDLEKQRDTIREIIEANNLATKKRKVDVLSASLMADTVTPQAEKMKQLVDLQKEFSAEDAKRLKELKAKLQDSFTSTLTKGRELDLSKELSAIVDKVSALKTQIRDADKSVSKEAIDADRKRVQMQSKANTEQQKAEEERQKAEQERLKAEKDARDAEAKEAQAQAKAIMQAEEEQRRARLDAEKDVADARQALAERVASAEERAEAKRHAKRIADIDKEKARLEGRLSTFGFDPNGGTKGKYADIDASISRKMAEAEATGKRAHYSVAERKRIAKAQGLQERISTLDAERASREARRSRKEERKQTSEEQKGISQARSLVGERMTALRNVQQGKALDYTPALTTIISKLQEIAKKTVTVQRNGIGGTR